MPESNQKFLSDFVLSTIPGVIGKSRGIIFIPIITKIMGQDAYGIWTNFSVGLTLIATVASLSLGAATNKFLADAPRTRFTAEYWAIILITMLSATLTGLLLVLFRGPIASVIFGSSTQAHLIVILAGALIFSLYSRQSVQFYRSQRRMGVFAGVQSARSIGEVGTVVLAAVVFESITAILFAYTIFNLLLSTALGVAIINDYGIKRPNFERIAEYIRFGVPLVFSGAMYWVVNASDRYLITYFHSVDVSGGYSVVYAMTSGLTIFSMAIGTVLFPDLSALRANNSPEEYQQRLSSILKYYFVITIPAAVGLVVVTKPLLRLLSTESINAYADLAFILAPAMVAYGLVNILIQALLSDGRSQVSALIWGIIAVLNLGANVVLVPQYSAMGASVTTFGSFIIGLGIVVFWKRNDISISPLLLGKIFIASLSMGITVSYIRDLITTPSLGSLLVLVGVGIFVYGFIGFASGVISRREIKFVLKSI